MGLLNYQHFLITRFNLKQNVWIKDRNSNPISISNDNWLKQRFELFETYCLPSVRAQSCKNFKWLIYFDTNTSESYKNKIINYQKIFPNILPKFIFGMKELLSSIKKDISTETSNSIVITTRLDNDDCLHENFIEKIQFCILNNQVMNGIVDIPNGYCLQIKPKPILSISIQYSNAFITYVEPYISADALKTVMNKEHRQWAYSTKTFVIEKEKLWMQIIHEKNVYNKLRGIILNDKNILNKFNIDKNIFFDKNTFYQIFNNKYVQFPFYYLLKQVKNILIKISVNFK
jgi:hypothetical protein